MSTNLVNGSSVVPPCVVDRLSFGFAFSANVTTVTDLTELADASIGATVLVLIMVNVTAMPTITGRIQFAFLILNLTIANPFPS